MNTESTELDDYGFPDMLIVITKIGIATDGIDGRDEYIMLTRRDGNMSAAQAKAWLLARVYDEGRTVGGYYCHTVSAVQKEYSTNQVICTVEHRYDI